MEEAQGSLFLQKTERWIGDTEGKDTAQVYATLAIAEQIAATAEQLKRIGDALENIAKALER